MNDEFRQMVIEKLRRGEDLPPEWTRELFPPEKREYELVYHGKEREEDIIADTMAVPLQPVRTFGKNTDEWHNMLIFGDNLQVMKTLLEQKKADSLCNADGTLGVRLVYIDPPFATKQDFKGLQEQRAYQDKILGAKFIEFLRKRLILLKYLLSDDGSIYIHLDYKKGHYIKIILDELLNEGNFINQIIWKRTSAHSDSKTLGNAHDIIFHYGKTSSTVYNKQSVRYSEDYVKKYYKHSDEKGPFLDRDLTARSLKGRGYNYTWNGIEGCWRCPIETMKKYHEENRLYYTRKGRPRLKQYLNDQNGRYLQDVWDDINVINSQAVERIDYPTQKPEKLLERIILASSNEGDIVLDAFVGSGTACAVAEKLGRRWVGVDCGKLAVYTIQKRMLSLKSEIGNKGKPLKPKPFTLYNAGLYDFSTLSKLPWADWRFFALQLFGCKDEPHTIGGLNLDGKLKGASVLVFNHLEYAGKRIDEETVQDIHAAIGKRIGRRFFIVAPRGVFNYQQDYIDLDGVRYYALRIPYSVINELHHREFTALQQPNDDTAVNEPLDAVGFDFIQPPEVEWKVSVKKHKGQLFDEACLKIRKFESRARIRGRDTKGGLETFSMLMLDLNYNGEVFDLDRVFYAHQLESENWEAWFPVEAIGKSIMAVFMDIYGNESREVIQCAQFGIKHAKTTTKKKIKKAPSKSLRRKNRAKRA